MNTNKILAMIIAFAMIITSMSVIGFAASDVATISGTGYETLAAALEAAEAMSGDVTINLVADAEWVTGGGHGSTPMIGADAGCGLVTINGYGHKITATGAGVGSIRDARRDSLLTFNEVNFVDESVSYDEGAWEFTYLEFAGSLAFNNCTFASGISIDGSQQYDDEGNQIEADLANVVFTKCSFNSSVPSEYSVWVSSGDVKFYDCKFTGTRAIKVHEDYGSEVEVLTVEECLFENIEKKPAIAIGTLNAETEVAASDNKVLNAVPGDQGEGLYETDTDLSTITFVNENNVLTCGSLNQPPYVWVSGAEGTESYREAIKLDTGKIVAEESVVVKFYSGETLVATTTLRESDRDDESAKLYPVNGGLTVNAVVKGRASGSWNTVWAEEPNVALTPDKVELYVDGSLADTWNGVDKKYQVDYAKLSGVKCVARNMTTGIGYASIKEAVGAANDGETVRISEGNYAGGVNVSKSITLEGTLDKNGEIATFLYGDSGLHGSVNVGTCDFTIKNIAIEAWAGVYVFGKGDLTVDNVTIRNATYGIHVDEHKPAGDVVTIKNCDIDVNWGNSLASGEYKIIVENNIFRATSGLAMGLNLYNGNAEIKENVFKSNSTILYNKVDLSDKVIYGANYFEDGVANAFRRVNGDYTDNIFPVYVDEAKTKLSNITIIDNASVGNVSVKSSDILLLVKESDLESNVTYEISAENVTPEVPYTAASGEKVKYVDISVLRNGAEYPVNNASPMTVTVDIGEVVSGDIKVYHFDGSNWQDVNTDAVTTGSSVRFYTDSFSPFAFVYSEGTVTEIASAIELKLEKKADDLYDVVLYGADNKVINRFMSGELTFELVSDTLAYEIVKNGFVNIINPVDDTEKYGFNLNGTNAPDITGKKITIASVKLNGYGEGKLSVVDGVVRTAEIADNIVDTFIDDNTLILKDAKDVAVNVPVPQQKLTIEIDFPNAVNDNVNAYQQMWVTVSGGDLAEDKVFNLGNDITKEEIALADGIYSMSYELTKNIGYNIEVKGAGYRTARYYVVMTEDKTVKFWNNVKDNATEMEFYTDEFGTEFKKGATDINFLAGDIVADNTINIYDLSAVVSYFGEGELQNTNTGYAKYDLNRDGKIDSKDVAYVLVSWGK